jgi:2-hydroxychromene-2-carboxylate isomerase
MPQAKKSLLMQDLSRSISRLGLKLSPPPNHPVKMVNPLRLITSCPDDQKPVLTRKLYHAYWAEGKDISNEGVLHEVAGISASALTHILQSETNKTVLRDNTQEAVKLGAFGVPTFEHVILFLLCCQKKRLFVSISLDAFCMLSSHN